MAFYDVIRYQPSFMNWIMYKHPVDEFNNNSRLIVSPGQVAIVVHNGKIEKIVEEGTIKIKSDYLPFLKNFSKSFFGGKTAYPIEIYFINKVIKLNLFWGTSDPIKLTDPKYQILINVRARGQIGLKLVNYQYFYQTLIGSLMKDSIITYDVVQEFFRGKLNQIIKKNLSTYIINNKITFLEIDTKIDEIQTSFEEEIREELKQFGFDVINLSVESINVPDTDLDKLNDILHKKAEYVQLGDQVYRTTRGYDVLEAGANNNGSAAAMMGIGMGMNMGGQMQGATIIPPAKENDESKDNFKCPSCGKDIASDAKFCPECGTKIIRVCPECGKSVSVDQKFCPECGKALYKKED